MKILFALFWLVLAGSFAYAHSVADQKTPAFYRATLLLAVAVNVVNASREARQ